MEKPDTGALGTESPDVPLPETASNVAREHPELWGAFQRLGEAASRAGPLDERTRRLVHLAFAMGARCNARVAGRSGPAPRENSAPGAISGKRTSDRLELALGSPGLFALGFFVLGLHAPRRAFSRSVGVFGAVAHPLCRPPLQESFLVAHGDPP